MSTFQDRGREAPHEPHTALCGRWQELCSLYLPLSRDDSPWRYSRAPAAGDPVQGWKLHVSATVLKAGEVLERVAPFLLSRGVMFKAPAILQELNKINTGLFYGYSQVGKFITVYPQSDGEAVSLAERLDELTAGMTAPLVPFDLRLRPGSCIYYRYGAFKPVEMKNPDGTLTPAVRDPAGNLFPDARDSAAAKPWWATDPFAGRRTAALPESADTQLSTTFRAYRALAQRGRGGVYEAIDVSVSPPRLCVLKEGRAGGEIGWDGRDGFWRVRHEGHVINALRDAGVEAPRVYASFVAEDNYYLVTELIEGETLHDLLRRSRRRLTISSALTYGTRLADLLSLIHSAGWAWRDCKPANVILTRDGDLRPLDFEGACPAAFPDPAPWGTPAFSPPARQPVGCVEPRIYDDLYALGATIYFMLTASLPRDPDPVPLGRLRRDVPAEARRIISELLDTNPRSRPSPQTVADCLANAILLVGRSRGGRRLPSDPCLKEGASGFLPRMIPAVKFNC